MSNLAEKLPSEKVRVCSLNDPHAGLGVGVLVKGQQVALFKLSSGELVAVGNYDPFSEANVLSRGLVGDLQGQKVVASPIYKNHFNLHTGECLEDASVRIPVYAVVVEGDAVFLVA